MKFYLKMVCHKKGDHVHITFFTAKDKGRTYANNGVLVMRYDEEWPVFSAWISRSSLRGVTIFEEVIVKYVGFGEMDTYVHVVPT